MNKFLSKILFLILLTCFSVHFCSISYASVDINATSILEYEKSGIPYSALRIEIENPGEKIEGILTLEVYENSKSVYNLVSPIYIYANSSQHKDVKVNLNGNANDIFISLTDEEGKMIASRTFLVNNISHASNLSMGLIAAGPVVDIFDRCISNSIDDDCSITIVDEEKYYDNEALFNNLDILVLSDIDMNNFSSYFSRAVYDFIDRGGVCYILYKDFGPYIVVDELRNYFADFNFNKNQPQKNIDVGNGMIIARNESFFDSWIEGTSANSYTKNYIDLTLSLDRISRIRERKMVMTSEVGVDTNRLIERDNTVGMPNIYLHFILIALLIILIGPIPFFLSRRFVLFKVYNQYALIVSTVFVAFIVVLNITYSNFRVVKNQSNIVTVDRDIAREISYVTLRFPYTGDYTFDVENNAEIIPILSENEIATRNIQDNNIKNTTVISSSDTTVLEITNKEVYSKNSFYVTREYDNIYQISFDALFFDDHFVGSINNAMNKELKNVVVMSRDKYINIGSLAANSSIELSGYNTVTIPINNNKYVSDIVFKDNPEFLKTYLDLNAENSNENIYLFFNAYDAIEPNITGEDVSMSTGNTVFVYKSDSVNNISRRDISLLDCDVNVVKGTYDKYTNSILGNEEVIIEYTLDPSMEYGKMYMNQIESSDFARIQGQVLFKGNIYLYNYATESYDLILAHVIHSPKNYISLDGKMLLRYIPNNADESYRNMYLTYFRIVGGFIR